MEAQEILKIKREKFVEVRTSNAMEIDKFLSNVSKIDPALLEGIEPLYTMTSKEIIPSMWQEPFDEDKYNQELNRFQIFVDQVQSVAERLNAKAMRILRGEE